MVLAAAVGVGPAGTQQRVVVVAHDPRRPAPLASADLRRPTSVRPRGRTSPPCSSSTALPIDIRHDSKIDRTRVARWADHVLAGGRPRLGRRP